ncbi:MAG TPA: hypothetical protein VF657_23760 [Actinoplanes sp.]|jgi:hypothetical protein
MADDLLDLAGGNHRLASVLRGQLATLSSGPDAVLREMADAVLKGELAVRDATHSDIYGSAIGVAFGTFWTAYQAMTPEARTELAEPGHQHLADEGWTRRRLPHRSIIESLQYRRRKAAIWATATSAASNSASFRGKLCTSP